MKIVNCTGCGSKELIEEDSVIVCVYCQTKYFPDPSHTVRSSTVIGVSSDIGALLQKCREDPANAQRYASLVLDLDPTNAEARMYFQQPKKRKWF